MLPRQFLRCERLTCSQVSLRVSLEATITRAVFSHDFIQPTGAMSIDFHLVHETARGAGAAIPLQEGTQLLGRGKECDILLMDKSISRKHARLTVTNGAVRVEDLNSRNGTFVGNQKIDSVLLIPEQEIVFGTLSFRLVVISADLDSDEETFQPSSAQIDRAKKHPLFAKLTEAQMRVLAELITGASEIQIASKLILAKTTVHNHAKSIYATLGVHTRAQLICKFIDAQRD